jgi:CheY-like chemotaxis protein
MKTRVELERKILIVEDHDDNRDLLRLYLELCGYQHIREASHGQEALELAQQDCPDLILMDIQMPVMDGLTATRLMREIIELCDVPIIAVTANHKNVLQEQAWAAGVTDIIHKPLEFEELQKLLNKYLSSGPR